MKYDRNREVYYLLSTVKDDVTNTYDYKVNILDLYYPSQNISPWYKPFYNTNNPSVLNDFKLYYNYEYLAAVGIDNNYNLFTWNQKTDFNGNCVLSGSDNMITTKEILSFSELFYGNNLSLYITEKITDKGGLSFLKYTKSCIQY